MIISKCTCLLLLLFKINYAFTHLNVATLIVLHDLWQCQECFHHQEHRLTWKLATLCKIMPHIQLGNPSNKMCYWKT